MVEIGSWIDLKIEQVGTIKTISLITGKVIGSENKTNFGLGLVFILLLVVFLLTAKKSLDGFKASRNKHP